MNERNSFESENKLSSSETPRWKLCTSAEDVTRPDDFAHRRCETIVVQSDDHFILEE